MARSSRRSLPDVARALAQVPDLADFRGAEVDEPTVALLREAETRVRHLRQQAENQLAGAEPRPCARCGGSVTGRADRRFCSDRCRKAAHRRSAVKVAAAAGGALLMGSAGMTVITVGASEPKPAGTLYRSTAELYRPATAHWPFQLPCDDHDQPEPDSAYAFDYVDNLGTAPTMVNRAGRPGWNTAGAASTMSWPTPRPPMPGPRFGWETSPIFRLETPLTFRKVDREAPRQM
jgi:hypothetical protein